MLFLSNHTLEVLTLTNQLLAVLFLTTLTPHYIMCMGSISHDCLTGEMCYCECHSKLYVTANWLAFVYSAQEQLSRLPNLTTVLCIGRIYYIFSFSIVSFFSNHMSCSSQFLLLDCIPFHSICWIITMLGWICYYHRNDISLWLPHQNNFDYLDTTVKIVKTKYDDNGLFLPQDWQNNAHNWLAHNDKENCLCMCSIYVLVWKWKFNQKSIQCTCANNFCDCNDCLLKKKVT